MQQLGRFNIDANVFSVWTQTDFASYFGANFIPYKQEYNYITKKFEFLAYSSLFTEVDESKEIPLYELNFSTEDVVVTTSTKHYKVAHANSAAVVNAVATSAVANAIANTSVNVA